MKRTFNLAEWAVTHRPFVTFFMIALLAAGAWSYLRLGRSEDPPFTVKVMIVQARWPGATIADTLQELTERLEKKLQETPNLDYVRSRTAAGEVLIEVLLKGSVSPNSVPDIWYQVRKKINDIRATLPQGVIGPEFNDEFGDTYSIIYGFTADGFTHRELRDYAEHVRSVLLLVPDVNKVDLIGAQDERIYFEFSARRLASLNIDLSEVIRALQAQNEITPAGTVRTSEENVQVLVSGGFTSETELRQVNIVSNGRLFRLTDIGTITRGYADPTQPMFRVNGKSAIGVGISMREGGDVVALGRNVKNAMNSITAGLPVGIEPSLVADQPTVVSHAVGEFMRSFEEAIVIVMAISFLSLGLRAGTVVALSIPLVLAIVFVLMDYSHIALQRVSLGALIVALGLLVDDAMITVETMVRKVEEGWDRAKAATYAYDTTHFPMGTGTLVIVVAFLPLGLARSSAGEFLFSFFAVVASALIISWFVAAFFTPLIGAVLLSDKSKSRHHDSGRMITLFRRMLIFSMRRRFATVSMTIAAFALAVFSFRFVLRPVLSSLEPTGVVC